jgi:mannan endo-1,4-beta-mannosidase
MNLPGAAAAAACVALLCQLPLKAQEPVNPHASPEARALLKYLYSISGRYTLAGQHNYPNTIARWTDRAYDLTGKYPALFGQDFGFSAGDDKDSILSRPAMIAEVERQYRNGAVVTLTWHAVRPTEDEPVSFRESVQGHLTDFEWKELLTPGSHLYNRWCAQVDAIASYLKQLRDARIPVLFRPYHEINGGWFWWNGRKGEDGSAALYRQLFDRLVNYHKLDNLIWVWNASPPSGGPSGPGPYADYFPGLQYADILSVDIYGEFKPEYYEGLVALAAGKPVALGEVGAVPSPEVLKAQPKWAWFMSWSDIVELANSVEALRATYDAPNVLTRDDPRLAEPMAAIRKASAEPVPELVTPEPTAEAKALLARLYRASGQHTLSGQANEPQAVSRSTDRVFEIAGKYPAIYGEDLGIPKEAAMEVGAARQAIVDEAVRQYRNHAVVTLTWRAARPTDDEPAGAEASVRGKLTDFEWNELTTPGTGLYQRWCTQVDAVAGYLKQLQDAGVPVLWRPYPEPNGTRFWWAGRKGSGGSVALYRQLFDRLVNHDKLHNLVWVWNAAAPAFGAESPGLYSDFFPGLQYVDALAVDAGDGGFQWRRDAELSVFGVGKVIGLGLTGRVPPPGLFAQQRRWAWFLASAGERESPTQSDALRGLYSDPRVVSRDSESER